MMKPSLLQVGKWLHSMGKKMQGFIEQFSQTLDKAQKIFDQVMAKLAKPDPIKQKMVFNTYNIFDVNHRQAVSADDIAQVSSLFGITALAGDKGAALHKKYDFDEDGFLDMEEFSSLMDDPSVPGCMSYVLRTFAKKLSQIAGQLKGAKMRDEVAECVTEFFQLMMAKNLTKTKWVSNALTNGSLPIQFSAAVFKQLVQQDKAPDKLTNLPVGRDIIGFMVQMAPDYVGKIMKEAADPGYWHRQGYDKKAQAPTIKTLKDWIEWSEKKYKNNVSLDGVSFLSDEDREEISASEGYQALKKEMASLTDEEMGRRISAYHRELRHEHLRHQNAIFHADATRVLFRHLLGDVTGKQSKPSADVLAVTKGGKRALPVTLKWKVLLVDNATQTSQMFQKFAFDYAKTSSNPIDNFANQIQAFIKKVEQFLDLMMDYTTPKGIHNIHVKIEDFLKRAEDDVQNVVNRILNTVMDDEGNLAEPQAVSALAVGSSKEHGIVMTIFHTVKDLLDMMKSFLPTVITDIKFA